MMERSETLKQFCLEMELVLVESGQKPVYGMDLLQIVRTGKHNMVFR